ncbi:MAG: phosphotransferase, partial [Paramuribaculum sp.]|nr:phosphotransferase [Paramuribaculum sp.]
MNRLIQLYNTIYGSAPVSIEPITGSASSRSYYRLEGVETVIGTIGTDRRENEAFLYLTGHFRSCGLNVPEVLAVSFDRMAYLQQDLGHTSLLDWVKANGIADSMSMLKRSVESLAAFNYVGAKDLDSSRCFPRAAMDHRSIMWDLNYFKYCFLKPSGIAFDEDRLEDAFSRLAAEVEYNPEGDVMIRDFQSRNILLYQGNPYLIDYQGARLGTGLYDLASLLWQSRLNLDADARAELAECYRAAVGRISGAEIRDFERRLALQALFRVMQVLGAYGFRGMIEGNAAFISPMATSLRYLHSLCGVVDIDPYLLSVLRAAAENHPSMSTPAEGRLKVRVMSFSYKKGLPKDWTGNGGGFVFDCRALPNPGRYEQYKSLTGMDKPVIDFLEADGEILEYLSQCEALVDRSVRRYLQRGFTDFMICFGCTGGQHRSVYSAHWMA